MDAKEPLGSFRGGTVMETFQRFTVYSDRSYTDPRTSQQHVLFK